MSPGERTRAYLAALSTRPAAMLVLDEPTNHLDLEGLEELERALDAFEGALVVVSHDRWFLRNLRPNRLLEVERGKVLERDPDRLVVDRATTRGSGRDR